MSSQVMPFTAAEVQDLHKILTNYLDWGVTLSGAIPLKHPAPWTARAGGLIVSGRLAIHPASEALFVAQSDANLLSNSEKYITALGDDVAERRGYVKISLTREADAGPWLEDLRAWMPQMREELDRGREEQVRKTAEAYTK